MKANAPEEAAILERLERTYEQLLRQLEIRETAIGIGNSPPNLKLKIQEYSNILQEVQKRLDKIYNREEPTEPDEVAAIQVHYAEAPEGKIVVGHHYGDSLQTALNTYNL